MKRRFSFVSIASMLGIGALTGLALAHPDSHGRSHFKNPPMNPTAVMRAFEGDGQPGQSLAPTTDMPCVGGFADIFPCSNIDLLSLTPLADLGGGSANDIWGWSSGAREFALIGLSNGTAFVEVTVPTAPVFIGRLPTHTGNSSWRDIKVYNDHAYIVSEASGHGMQVFDLTQLLTATPSPTQTFTDDGVYNDFGSAHNIAINEASGFAYAVGTGTCSGGLHIVDIGDPANPKSPLPGGGRACYSGDGYTHDVQCVNYAGPDTTYQGKEICFAANEDTLTIVDLSDKANPVQVSRTGYANDGYTHQTWVDESHGYVFLDDELDEQDFGHDTLTRVWDVSNLQAPTIVDWHSNIGVPAIDHNQYIRDDLVYQANYRSGLRVLEILRDGGDGYLMMDEIGYFDVYPASDSANFNGAWSNYPFLPSGNILISGIEQGLFVVALNAGDDQIQILSPGDDQTVFGDVDIDIVAVDAEGGAPGPVVEWAIDAGAFQPTGVPAGDLYSAVWPSAGAGEGWHDLTARMTDSAANETSSTIQIFVNNLPPAVQLISPSAGNVSGNVALVATADADGSVVSVTFYDGANVLGVDGDPGDGFGMNWNTKRVAAGDHVLTAKATDNRGQMTTSSAVTVTITGKGGGGGGPGGGGGGEKCFKNKEPLCDP